MMSVSIEIKDCSKLLQWHVSRLGMTNLFVKKNMTLDSKYRVVASLVAAVHVLFKTKMQLVLNSVFQSDNDGLNVCIITLTDADVRAWIQDHDAHTFNVSIKQRKRKKNKNNVLRTIGLSYVGVIAGIPFNIELHVSTTDMQCTRTACSANMCAYSCNGCGARYCGPDHQREHWHVHESECEHSFWELATPFWDMIQNPKVKMKTAKGFYYK